VSFLSAASIASTVGVAPISALVAFADLELLGGAGADLPERTAASCEASSLFNAPIRHVWTPSNPTSTANAAIAILFMAVSSVFFVEHESALRRSFHLTP
jgi:hypothetical protein